MNVISTWLLTSRKGKSIPENGLDVSWCWNTMTFYPFWFIFHQWGLRYFQFFSTFFQKFHPKTSFFIDFPPKRCWLFNTNFAFVWVSPESSEISSPHKVEGETSWQVGEHWAWSDPCCWTCGCSGRISSPNCPGQKCWWGWTQQSPESLPKKFQLGVGSYLAGARHVVSFRGLGSYVFDVATRKKLRWKIAVSGGCPKASKYLRVILYL